MSTGWFKPGKRRLKRQLSISQPLNFEHKEHVGPNGTWSSTKQSSSFQNIAELCKSLAHLSTADRPSSSRCSRSSSSSSNGEDLFNEITSSLAPDLKSFLISDSSDRDSNTGLSRSASLCSKPPRDMGCTSSGPTKNTEHKSTNGVSVTTPSVLIVDPNINNGTAPDRPIRKHMALRKVSDKVTDHKDLISDIIPNKNPKLLKVLDAVDKENLPSNLPPPITPRTAKKLKLKDDMFREMISRYCNKDNPSSRLRELRKLGQGSSGVVVLVHDTLTERKLALKKMNLHRQQRRDLLVNEVSVGALLHPNIVQTYSTHLVCDELWVLMEPLDAGSLTQLVENLHIAQLTEGHIARIAKGAVSALNYLHSLGVVHRDVKSDSILLSSSGQVKLSDFGYCDRITEDKPTCTGLIGTPHWMSPEIVCRKPYGTKTDIWSLGILMIEMLDGEPPNFADSQIVAMEKIKVSPPPSPAKNEISSALLSFLSSCLKLEPELRASACELLQHRLFNSIATEAELADAIRNFQETFKAPPVFK